MPKNKVSVLWIIYYLIQKNIHVKLMINPLITHVQNPESIFQIMEQKNNEIMSRIGQENVLGITMDLPQ